MKKIQRSLVLVFMVLASCNLGNATGYVPTVQEIREISIGGDTRASLVERFGPPTVIGQGEENWYYVASQRRYPGSLPTREIERRVLAIRFAGDNVAAVTLFGQERAQDVPISRYTTETGGREMTLWEQLYGNIGNFSAESFLANAQ